MHAASQPAEGGKLPVALDQALFILYSDDGLKFADRSDPRALAFAVGRPALARLDGGRLLLVYAGLVDRRRGDIGLRAMNSSDEGKSWSKAEPLEIRGLNRRDGTPASPSLVTTADGTVRLFFECRDEKGHTRQFVAASKDGKTFDVARPLRFEKEGETLVSPVAVLAGRRISLIGQTTGRTPRAAVSRGRDERSFESPVAIKPEVPWRPLCAAPIDGGHRIFGSTRDGIVSATCQDEALRRWTVDKGVRVAGATTAAATRLKDGRYLMIVGRPVSTASRTQRDRKVGGYDNATQAARQSQTTGDSSDSSDVDSGTGATAVVPAGGAVGDDTRVGVERDTAAAPGEAAAGDAAAAMTRAQEGGGEIETEGGAADAAADSAAREQAINAARAAAEELGIPFPDFQTPVDFMDWLEARHQISENTENSYDYYRKCMPPEGQTWGQGEWPLLVNMFADTGYTEPPGPWHPELRPDWEVVFQQSRTIMANYAEAGRYAHFVRPLQVADPMPGAEDEPLIFSVLLPDLSGHRALIKQTFGDAWRAGPDGKVEGNQMLYAIETGLNAAEHVGEGDFLIEKLVSIAEKNLVHENARWALQHEILTPDQIQHGLEMLMEKDRPQQDPMRWVQGEAAAMLDMTQYAFGPIEPGREPNINPERLKKVVSFTGENETIDMTQYEGVDPHQTTQAITSFFKEYVDLSRQGYPGVKAKDLDALVTKHVGDNPLAKQFVPSLSRVYTLNQRNEASRRATQLTYAVHLYKARNGSWPASLDDLPLQYTQGVRTDPFNGQDFRYRLTTQGPMLYSASENGMDDGGTHHVRWGEATPDGQVPTDGDDYVFWPPQRR